VTLSQSDACELLDAIRAGGDIDVIRRGVELVLQALIDAEATEHIGADRYQRNALGHVEFPYLFADATYLKGRVQSQVVSRAVVVVTGVTLTGERVVLGCAVGDTETEAFWAEFLRSLRGRGLAGVRLVISDHHDGLKSAIAKCFVGAAWQRCRVHFVRNVLAKVPKANAEMVAAAIRTIFAQPTAADVDAQFDRIVATLEAQFPHVARVLADARHDLLAFTAFPVEHWRKLWSTNPLERVHREIKRRTDVVGVFPTTPPSTASSPPSSSNNTTNGPSPNAATCPKLPWPASARTRQPSPPPPPRASGSPADALRSTPAGDHFSTTTRDVIPPACVSRRGGV
jgi:transposase-like protein